MKQLQKTIKNNFRTISTVLVLGLLLLTTQVQAAGTIYVNASASGSNDGTSWTNAYTSLQSALKASTSGDEIWVAAGTYYPDVGTGQTDNDRDSTFLLVSGVTVYGGFAGTETASTQQDYSTNVTILDGDIGTVGTESDNAYHVVTGANDAVLDGFTIQNGYSVQTGPGGRNKQARVSSSMEAIISGAGSGSGGGVLNFQTAPTLRNLIIKNNKAGKGGGMYNMSGYSDGSSYGRYTAATLENVTIESNSATTRGGGMSNDYSDPTMTNVKFISNTTDSKGGGMYNDFDANPTMTNCLFVSNSAERAGAMGNDGASDPVITNCTFTKNHANDIGAGLYQGSGSSNDPVVTNSILWGNTLSYNGPKDISNFHETEAHITYSIIEDGHTGTGNLTSNPLFVDAANGDYSLSNGSPAINTGTDTGAKTTDLDGSSRVGTRTWEPTNIRGHRLQPTPQLPQPVPLPQLPQPVHQHQLPQPVHQHQPPQPIHQHQLPQPIHQHQQP